MLDKEEFRNEISKMIREALADVSAETRLDDKVKTLLESADSTISDLLETIEGKDKELSQQGEEVKSLKEQVEGLTGKTKELEDKLTASDAELKGTIDKVTVAEERATVAEGELTKIAHDRRLEVRIAELAEAKILKIGEKAEAQKAKIREMSDEEYAYYKEELVDLRQSVEASLKEVAADGEEHVDIAPPAISKEQASSVHLDVENQEPVGKGKFKDLGAALAKRLKNEK